MIHPLKITSTLSDETRYQIYEYMLQQKKSFTVQAIAEQFSIHPNVARLHLTKLTEINLISAYFVKSGKGGRPGREYKASEDGIELSFPKREASRLIKWTMQLIEQLGPEAIETAKKISYGDGYNQMKEMIANEKGLSLNTFNEKVILLTNASALIGYIPEIIETAEGKKIIFSIYNCPFKKQLSTDNEIVCILHESYLAGQIDVLFPQNEFVQVESMIHDCENCKYEIEILKNVL
ncbi:metalloregulator ArsR/SmtB family transcription factor [Lysinibacillus sp. SGAir0095]|uniref:helix-turn-helix transcriptional regulator n=1 Tax=Lysinibacillus sp. SGAir0095 TaxID=2070463 RepID=UPI0010CD380F|nr:helix-turn-helix domain-containing protein [Lysinibacillus sp. SGAir0095]QCR32848.1 transcriptional regulator [Lysinibacillus sp. SGAir0095]